MRSWFLLVAAVASEVTATLALKGALDRPALYVVVVAGYVAAFTLLTLVFRAGMGLGVAYGIWAALGVAGTALLSALLFDEAVTPVMLVGIVLVVLGVLAVEVGSHRAHRGEVAP
ncbi:DMT family transporter [Nocardioides baculatus]|uniref:QacE family quaternary ammonium compound efflux SMR transporter n=1 Tax=Nocardioides baculatus TaxID=2801337 RepID=A0ABS1L4Y8_9ACTN|nr:SMR family transporter [Nocardioides baculatus]MBL0746749.1 QacE family quaternary ammonium compound efflux SMR transporter [Nocardioides baculatus]